MKFFYKTMHALAQTFSYKTQNNKTLVVYTNVLPLGYVLPLDSVTVSQPTALLRYRVPERLLLFCK